MKRIPYLIQRGWFRDEIKNDKIGIDKCLCFDYMGAAEFEWGALPKSLHRIYNNLDFRGIDTEFLFRTTFFKNSKYNITMIDILGKSFCLLCDDNIFEADTIKNYIIDIAKNKIHCKELTYFHDALFDKSDVSNFPPNTKINFWWDVENDWMLFKANEKHYEMFMTSLLDGWIRYDTLK